MDPAFDRFGPVGLTDGRLRHIIDRQANESEEEAGDSALEEEEIIFKQTKPRGLSAVCI